MRMPRRAFASAAADPERLIALSLVLLALAIGVGAWWQVLAGRRVLIGGDILYGCCYPWGATQGAHPSANISVGDPVDQFTPWLQAVQGAFRAGHLPLWDDSEMSGKPLLANDQSSPFSPFTWIASLFPAAIGLSVLMLLKLVVGGVGMWLFLRACGARSPPAVVAAIGYATSSFVVVWLGWYQGTVAVLLPLSFAAAEWWLGSRAPLALPAFTVATALQLVAGNPEASVHAAFAITLYVVVRAAALRRDGLVGAVALAVAGAAGSLLAAPQLLPFVHELQHTALYQIRVGEHAGLLHLTRGEAMSWLAPNARGNPGIDHLYGWLPNYNEATGFSGVWALLVAPLAARWVGPRGRSAAVALLVLIVVAAGNVYGPLTPVIGRLPLLAQANGGRMLIDLCFAVSAAAGLGLDRLLGSAPRRAAAGGAAVAAGALGLVALVALAVVFGQRRAAVDTLLPTVHGWFGFWLVVAAVSLVAAAGFAGAGLLGWPRAALLGFGVCALTEGALFAIPFNPLVPLSEVPPATATTSWLQEHASGGYIAATGSVLNPNTATLYGLRDVRGSDLLIDARLESYWAAADPGYDDGSGSTVLNSPDVKMLAAAGVEYVLTPDRPLAGAEVAVHAEHVYINRIPDARPFAFIAPATAAAADQAAAVRLLRKDPLGPVVLEGECCPPPRQPGQAVRVLTREPGDVLIDVNTPSAAAVTVLQSYAEGWSARVDGRPATVQAADVHFQAVRVAAGHHRVELVYSQPQLALGLLLALAGLVLAGAQSLFAPWWRTKSLTR